MVKNKAMKYSYGSKLVRHLFVIYTDFIRDAIRMANGCGNNQKKSFLLLV